MSIKIAKINFYKFELPMYIPFVVHGQEVFERKGFLIELIAASGEVGYGEVSPLPAYNYETERDILKQFFAIHEIIRFTEDEIIDLSDLYAIWYEFINRFSSSVIFGFESALWMLAETDVDLQGDGTEFIRKLNISDTYSLPLNGLLQGSVHEIKTTLDVYIKKGYPVIKLKVGRRDIDQEVDLIKWIHATIPVKMKIRLDANCLWSMDQAVEFSRRIPRGKIEYIEEPISDYTNLHEFYLKTGLPYALDEHVSLIFNTNANMKGLRACIIKPTLIGGLVNTVKLADRAKEIGAYSVITSSYESGIGLTMLAELCLLLGLKRPVGLDTFRVFKENLIDFEKGIKKGRVNLKALYKEMESIKKEKLHKIDVSKLFKLPDL